MVYLDHLRGLERVMMWVMLSLDLMMVVLLVMRCLDAWMDDSMVFQRVMMLWDLVMVMSWVIFVSLPPSTTGM